MDKCVLFLETGGGRWISACCASKPAGQMDKCVLCLETGGSRWISACCALKPAEADG